MQRAAHTCAALCLLLGGWRGIGGLYKRLAKGKAIALPWVRARGEGKGSARHEPFTSQCGSARFVRSAWPMAGPMARLGCAHGGAHCGTAYAQPKGKPVVDPLARSLRGGEAHGQGHCCSAGVEPSAPRQRRSQWPAIAPCASRFAVRAPVRAPKEG